MPSYEAALIIRSALDRPQLKTVVKAACQQIMNEGGLIKQLENLGHRELPHITRAHKLKHTHGNYFCIQFNSSSDAMCGIAQKYKHTKEIVRYGILKKEEEPRRPCLDGPCLFGELPNPDHDRAVYSRKVLRRFKNNKMSNV
ncbi:probable 28S ribosomal protein S6, mitochondrial [Mercenaria mercenaria]|uniref:probable 28S ribosomal protein S6, mitochondrial n=1 Tax=Mercenaria mercenaria TaxID=6596 RepID=UPI00234F3263|nr:probable 28S ribosomal protein S6, mitochondrial [Mercenaria mercenaria]